MLKQPAFDFESFSQAETAKPPDGNNPVTGDEQRYRISGAGSPDCACRCIEFPCQFAIAARLPVGNPPQCRPDPLLKRRPPRCHRHRGQVSVAAKIRPQASGCPPCRAIPRRGRHPGASDKPQVGNRTRREAQFDAPQWSVDCAAASLIHVPPCGRPASGWPPTSV